MSVEVDPDSPRVASGTLAQLSGEVDSAPFLGAAEVAAQLVGSSVGSALGESNTASTGAKQVVKARYDQFASLLSLSADTYSDSDAEAAARIAGVPDINSATSGR